MTRRLVAVVAHDLPALVRGLHAALEQSRIAIAPFAVPDGATARTIATPLGTVPHPVALVVRTSGSSGRPKQVMLTAAALLASAAATEGALGGPGEWVLALPPQHIAGVQVIVRAITAGSAPHPVAPGPFTARAFAAAVAGLPADRRRYSSLVPTQLHRVVAAIEAGDRGVAEAVRSLDALLIGGGRLDAPLGERAARAGVRIVRTYGMSETSGGCVYDGVPLAGADVRVVDDEVRIAGPMLALGYRADPERTAEAFLVEPGRRWYRTGDRGAWQDGRLAVTGRLDDVIVTGGEKVSLGLVEQVVRELPGLEGAVVLGVPDPEWGEVPVVAATAEADLDALRAAVAGRLGRAAAPRRVIRLDPLPTLPSGKPDLQRIRQRLGGPTA